MRLRGAFSPKQRSKSRAASVASAAAAGEQGLLVRGERGLDVIGVRGDGLAEFGAVEHGQVGALAVGGARWAASPSRVTPGTRSQRCPIGRAWSVRSTGAVSPSVIRAVSSGAQPSNSAAIRACPAVGEVDAGEPVLRLGQRHVGVQDPAGLAVGLDPLAGDEASSRAAADRLAPRGVPLVGVEQVRLDERRADVLGRRVGQQRPDARPRAVRADEQARGDGRAVGEGHLVPAVAERADTGDLAAPPDGAGRERVEQELPQVAASTSGRPPVPSSGSSSRTVPCGSRTRVASAPRWMRPRNSSNRPAACKASCPLCSWMSSCRPGCGPRRGLRLVDRGRDAVDVQDAGEREAAEAGADDRDGVHRGSFQVWNVVPCRPAWNNVP